MLRQYALIIYLGVLNYYFVAKNPSFADTALKPNQSDRVNNHANQVQIRDLLELLSLKLAGDFVNPDEQLLIPNKFADWG